MPVEPHAGRRLTIILEFLSYIIFEKCVTIFERGQHALAWHKIEIWSVCSVCKMGNNMAHVP